MTPTEQWETAKRDVLFYDAALMAAGDALAARVVELTTERDKLDAEDTRLCEALERILDEVVQTEGGFTIEDIASAALAGGEPDEQ